MGVFPPGFFMTYGPYLRESHGRAYFGGTETATSWAGYMNGGIQSGERAARQVLVAMGLLDSDQIYQQAPVSTSLPPVDLSELYHF